MVAWEDKLCMRRKYIYRYGRRVFHFHTVIGMAQFIPVFYVHEASTQQAVVRWGEVYFSHVNSSSSCLVGIFGDPLGLRSEWGCWVSKEK